MFTFRLDASSGVPPYLQLVHQVRHAVLLGTLRPGDRLPPIREVVDSLALNPNTVAKAYRALERESLVTPRPGQGTFVNEVSGAAVPPAVYASLRRGLQTWIRSARQAGLDEPAIAALLAAAHRETGQRGT